MGSQILFKKVPNLMGSVPVPDEFHVSYDFTRYVCNQKVPEKLRVLVAAVM